MSLLVWDDSYSVNVGSCDEDHKKLFALTNELHEAMKRGKATQVLDGVVKSLADYTRYHFAREEALMEKTQYPNLIKHREQHVAFVKKVEEFQQHLKTGAIGQSIAVTDFLRDWLTNHIKKTDRQYSGHLNANGVS